MNQDIKIGNRLIGQSHRPFIIAEMSGNHNQSLDRALSIVKAASEAGAHAIKLQTYTADTMTIKSNSDVFIIKDSESLWANKSLYQLYEEAHTPWEWHAPIMDFANQLGLICFSSPFDESAVDFLESLNVPCYKIASFENTDIDLIKRVAKTKKPMIISTGMASIDEIGACVEAARTSGCKDLVLLKCTSTYPASPENTHLRTIPDIRDRFNCSVGLSDHTMGVGTSIAAIALGAIVIEKHFTLNRADGGVDSQFSLEPHELESLVTESERAWLSLGTINYGGTASESKSKMFRRSLYFVKPMKAGDIITDDCIKSLRPNLGLALNKKASILGKSVIQDIPYGTPVSLDHIKDHGQ